MRMHEDVRPFSCSLCDQTFRQKAHLQRHETTHGLGAKVHRSPASGGGTPGSTNPKRKRKRSRGSNSKNTSGSTSLNGTIILPDTPVSVSENLQRRLAHVSEKFGRGSNSVSAGQNEEDEEMEEEEEGEESDSRDADEVIFKWSLWLFDILDALLNLIEATAKISSFHKRYFKIINS